MHWAPASPADVDDADEPRLVVLGPECPHAKGQESRAQKLAARIVDERAAGPRLNRNMLVFLAADAARLEELRDAVRQVLAWHSIVKEKDALNLDTIQRAQAEARLAQAALGGGADPGALRVAPAHGARPRALVAARPRATAQLWADFAQYLYLPRLRDREVLRWAIADGVPLVTWRQDGFAYPQGYDQEAGRYRGLSVGEQAAVLIDAESVVVKPEAALRQTATGTVTGVSGIETGEAVGTPAVRVEEVEARPPQPRRFHGSVRLDPSGSP